MSTLIFCEHTNGKIKKSSLELFSASPDAEAFLFGAGASDAAKEIPASKVYVCNDDTLTNYNSEAYTHAATEIIKKSGAKDFDKWCLNLERNYQWIKAYYYDA